MNSFSDIDQYIAGFPPEIRSLLHAIRATIRKAAPEAGEKISYGMPTFVHNGLLVHFAVNKNHIGFYPAPSGIEAFRDKLSGWKFSKGAIQFPLNKDIPLELIEEITAFRYKENSGNNSNKNKAIKQTNIEKTT